MKPPKAALQLPLAFQHVPASGREDLLIADPLSAAVTLVDSWPDWPSPVVILAGPIGSGKSHLAAIWRARSGAAEIHPVENGGAEEVAAAGPVLFEDVDRRGFSDRSLFHVINNVRQNGHTLLMTSRRGAVSPREKGPPWTPRLCCRFASSLR